MQMKKEEPKLVRGLWRAADDFLRENPPMQMTEWYSSLRRTRIFRYFYNNFELSAISVWLSAEYQRYVDYIDRRGGIYHVRWGDAPIKTIAVTLFVHPNRTHQFRDIAYRHQKLKVKGGSQ
jgi:Glycolipid 2-alpha-mannosyltransferase